MRTSFEDVVQRLESAETTLAFRFVPAVSVLCARSATEEPAGTVRFFGEINAPAGQKNKHTHTYHTWASLDPIWRAINIFWREFWDHFMDTRAMCNMVPQDAQNKLKPSLSRSNTKLPH